MKTRFEIERVLSGFKMVVLLLLLIAANWWWNFDEEWAKAEGTLCVCCQGLCYPSQYIMGDVVFTWRKNSFLKVDPSKILMVSLFSVHKFNVYSNPNIWLFLNCQFKNTGFLNLKFFSVYLQFSWFFKAAENFFIILSS